MSQTTLDRRSLIAAAALAGPAVAATAAAGQPAPAAGGFAPKPLPVDPKTVPWLSEKLLVSHHDNNYAGAVKRLGAIQGELRALDPAKAPTYTLNGLKREELLAWNSMILHELYFAGLGAGPGPGKALGGQIEHDFGSMDRWRAEFAGLGKALGGGSGWVLLTWSRRDGRLANQWAADHTMALAGATPLLALDMYEHAYHMDYGAKAGAYVDAFMNGFNWRTAEAAFAQAV